VWKCCLKAREQFRGEIAFADLAAPVLFDAHETVQVAAGGCLDKQLGGKITQSGLGRACLSSAILGVYFLHNNFT